LLAALLALAPLPLLADEDLYAGVVPVSSQSAAEREAALPAALAQVLGKLSGLRELPATPEMEAVLADAGSALIAFGYRQAPRLQADGTELEVLLLEARFAPPSVDRMARQLALPRWRPERSPVVLWIVVDDGLGRSLAPVEYQYAFESAALTARLRGQPVEWPGLSPELQEQLDLQLLWGGYTEQLLADGADNAGVLVAAARREGPEWNVRWSFADGLNADSWRTNGTDLQQALNEGMHELADRVAALSSIGPEGLGVFRSEILVSELRGSSDYARVLAYLDRLSLVDEVDVMSLGPNGLRLSLQLNAAPGFLETSLEQDGFFEPLASASGVPLPGSYRLVRPDEAPPPEDGAQRDSSAQVEEDRTESSL
jgi:hypothetical protein